MYLYTLPFPHHNCSTVFIFSFGPEYKRARQEIKKKSSDTLKLQKKAKKGIYNKDLI